MADMNQWVNTQKRKALEELLVACVKLGPHATTEQYLTEIDEHIAKYE